MDQNQFWVFERRRRRRSSSSSFGASRGIIYIILLLLLTKQFAQIFLLPSLSSFVVVNNDSIIATSFSRILSSFSIITTTTTTRADSHHHQISSNSSRNSTSGVIDGDEFKATLTANGIDELHNLTLWGANHLCEFLQKHAAAAATTITTRSSNNNSSSVSLPPPPLPLLVNVTFSCEELFNSHYLGTGNWIWLLYSMRLAAKAYGNVELRVYCDDEEDYFEDDNAWSSSTTTTTTTTTSTAGSLVLPWLMGTYKSYSRSTDLELLNEACHNHISCPIQLMLPVIQRDLRRMAVSLLVGRTRQDNGDDYPAAYTTRYNHDSITTTELQIPTRTAPLFPNIELDETILHYRCGDLVRSTHAGYAFHKFAAFTKYIPNETQSIGILTQPFHKQGQNRLQDSHTANRCEKLVNALVEYLQDHFPRTRLRIRNDPNIETVALAYARLILSKQAIITSVSTFGVFPALASFGQAFLIAPDFKRAPNQWLLKTSAGSISSGSSSSINATLIHDPNPLLAPQFKGMWENYPEGESVIIEWLRNDTFQMPLFSLSRKKD